MVPTNIDHTLYSDFEEKERTLTILDDQPYVGSGEIPTDKRHQILQMFNGGHSIED